MNIRELQNWVQSHLHHLLDLVRIYLGFGLAAKGVFFLMHPQMLNLPEQHASLSGLVQWVPWVHIIGGVFLAAGLFVRLAAFIQIPILAGAAFLVNMPQMMSLTSREGFEFSALVLFLTMVVFLKGAGPWSLSARFNRHTGRNEAYERWVQEHPDFFLDLIRVYLGMGLLMKGLLLAGGREGFAQLMERSSNMEILVMMGWHYVVPVHIMGGIFLMLGMATRSSAIAQLPALLGALMLIYLPQFSTLELRQSFEFATLVLFLLGILSISGAGRYSVDHVIQRQGQQRTGWQIRPAH